MEEEEPVDEMIAQRRGGCGDGCSSVDEEMTMFELILKGGVVGG